MIQNYFHRWEEDLEPAKDEEASEEEIQAFIDAGQEEGILEVDEGEMIQSIVQFGDKVAREFVRDVMRGGGRRRLREHCRGHEHRRASG